jgi:hypothetical protein
VAPSSAALQPSFSSGCTASSGVLHVSLIISFFIWSLSVQHDS